MAKTITVVIDDELYQKVARYCVEKNIKKKEFLTEAIKEFLKR